MTTFERAYPVIAEHEGIRFTNDPADPGGPTKGGLTLAWCQEHHLDIDGDGDVDVLDVRALTAERVEQAYREEIWDHYGYGRIVDQQVATKIFDEAVNMGPTRAHRYLQRALNCCGYSLREDGVLGEVTLSACNEACSREARELLLELCHLQTEHYRAWCDAKPERERFRAGLHRRGSWPFVPGGYDVATGPLPPADVPDAKVVA